RFCLVDSCICGRIHDKLRPNLSYCPANVRRIRKIQLIVAARNHFAHLGQETQKFCANLTVLPGQQDYRFHFPGSPGRCSVRTWVSFGYFASFSETTGTFIPQDILNEGIRDSEVSELRFVVGFDEKAPRVAMDNGSQLEHARKGCLDSLH